MNNPNENGWKRINAVEMPKDDLARAVGDLISLLNHIINENSPIGIDAVLNLRDQVIIASKFTRTLKDPKIRQEASRLLGENNDVIETIRIIRRKFARNHW